MWLPPIHGNILSVVPLVDNTKGSVCACCSSNTLDDCGDWCTSFILVQHFKNTGQQQKGLNSHSSLDPDSIRYKLMLVQ